MDLYVWYNRHSQCAFLQSQWNRSGDEVLRNWLATQYGKYASYGAYSRSAEAEADIEALLELASAIKVKRSAGSEE